MCDFIKLVISILITEINNEPYVSACTHSRLACRKKLTKKTQPKDSG